MHKEKLFIKEDITALFGDRLKVDIANMIYDTTEIIVENNKLANDYKDFEFELIRYFSFNTDISNEEFTSIVI